MKYEKTFPVAAAPAVALAYTADFRNLLEWEPSVTAVNQTAGDGPGEGACFDVSMRFMGRDSSMRYRCEAYDDTHAFLSAEGDGFTAVDRISVRDDANGCEVTYFTDITLTTRLGQTLEPLIALIFGFNVRKAVKHLQARINACA